MSVYSDAVQDAKQFVAVAEQRAKEKLLSATLPRLKQLIETEIVGASDDDDLDLDADITITEPDASGKVTLNVTPAVDVEDMIQDNTVNTMLKTPVSIIPTISSNPAPTMPALRTKFLREIEECFFTGVIFRNFHQVYTKFIR